MNDLQTSDILSRLTENAAGRPGPAILAIDGRCAAGKSTFAARLAAKWKADLMHMDDFYLHPEQRTKDRFAEPGGNVDRERFLAEVLLPLREGKPIDYRAYRPHENRYEETVRIEPGRTVIIEGSYACHPDLREFYDLRIFLDIGPEEQMRRILTRNGPEAAERFRTIWIPLEELYFNSLNVRDVCDIVIDSDQEILKNS